MNPYEELGLPPDASDEAVKRAYQRRARETHPDKGGDTEAFQRVNAAYQVLSDPGRRARFDETGATGQPEDENAQLLGFIASLVLRVVNADVDLAATDVMKSVRQMIEADIESVKSQRRDITKKITRHEIAIKRVRRKGDGQNVIAAMLESEASKLRALHERAKGNIDMLHKMLKFLDDYDYQVDSATPRANTYEDLIAASIPPKEFLRIFGGM